MVVRKVWAHCPIGVHAIRLKILPYSSCRSISLRLSYWLSRLCEFKPKTNRISHLHLTFRHPDELRGIEMRCVSMFVMDSRRFVFTMGPFAGQVWLSYWEAAKRPNLTEPKRRVLPFQLGSNIHGTIGLNIVRSYNFATFYFSLKEKNTTGSYI